jgi:hypothetical protein
MLVSVVGQVSRRRARLDCAVVISPPVVEELGRQLLAFGWITDLLVGGSVTTGEYTPFISALDLVALTDGPIDPASPLVESTQP